METVIISRESLVESLVLLAKANISNVGIIFLISVFFGGIWPIVFLIVSNLYFLFQISCNKSNFSDKVSKVFPVISLLLVVSAFCFSALFFGYLYNLHETWCLLAGLVLGIFVVWQTYPSICQFWNLQKE